MYNGVIGRKRTNLKEHTRRCKKEENATALVNGKAGRETERGEMKRKAVRCEPHEDIRICETKM